MAGYVCPWWGGYFIDYRLRRWLHVPVRQFRAMVASAEALGFRIDQKPAVRRCQAVVFRRGA